MFDFLKPKTGGASFEHELTSLAKAGICLKPGFDRDAVIKSLPRETFGQQPYLLLLCALGNDEGAGFPSDNIWHFDTECIEGNGSYSAIANRMATLSQGSLPLEQVEDFIDLDEESAWLSFALDGQTYRWEAKVQDDWVDASILSKLAALLESRQAGRRFIYIDLKGQDFLIGCSTPEQRTQLQNITGLKINWLT